MNEAPAFDGHGPPSAIMAWSKSAADLASHRSQALAEYWLALAGVRQPEEVMAVQVDYWAHLMGDYAAAAAEALAPFAASADGESKAASQPSADGGLH
jgi:hypothetical protein